MLDVRRVHERTGGEHGDDHRPNGIDDNERYCICTALSCDWHNPWLQLETFICLVVLLAARAPVAREDAMRIVDRTSIYNTCAIGV